jgi:hypothetical protein
VSRRFRSFAAVLALVALVYAQAMASVHACDGQAFARAAVATDAGAQPLPDCCDEEQPAQQPLCDTHCQQGKQTLDRGQAPIVAPVAATAFVLPLVVTGVDIASAPPAVHPPDLARITEPPISIRNCCFRI